MKYTPEDITAIFNQYKTKIYHLALKISRNTDEAQDILQNTFLKVINNLEKFRNESSISTWIYRIAINEAYMKWRVKKRQERLINLKKERIYLSGTPSSIPDKEVISGELKEEIDSAVKNLPLKYRVPVILRDFQDLEYLKISQILNISLQATKTRLHRARLELRRAISAYYEDKLQKDNSGRITKMNWATCSRSIKFLDSFFQKAISPQNKRNFKKHISDCRPCRTFINSYKEAIALAKCLQCKDIPEELHKKVISFLKKR